MKLRCTTIANIQLGICDVCANAQAVYDAKLFHGPWAYVCQDCFEKFGIGLGLGKGKKLTPCAQ